LPRVAMSPSGAFVTVWHNQDINASSDDGVYAQRYDAAGVRQGAEFRVNTYTQGNQQFPSVAMDGSGNFVVAWDSAGQDGSGEGSYAQRYNAAGVAQGSEFRLNSTTTGDQYGPLVVMAGAGNFVAVWETGTNLIAQRFDAAGAKVGGEFQINTLAGATATSPNIAMAPMAILRWSGRAGYPEIRLMQFTASCSTIWDKKSAANSRSTPPPMQ
jgi:hypothetical protein